MRFLDVACGAGAFSLGFKMAGMTPALGLDIDPIACATYSRNVGPVLQGDIAMPKVQKEILARCKGVECVIGSPPCQIWSVAGT